MDPVLLIDDHEDTRFLLVELLELDGHSVRTASNGAEALAMIREFRPCLILVDLGLPDVFGVELIRRLRAEPVGTAAPIYALSGFSNLRPAAYAAGCDGFLIKPVSGADLRRVVQEHCLGIPPGAQEVA